MNELVIGGGFAGVAAACRLAAAGRRPILLERAPRLGGRASSFQDPATGEWIDYGHHILMGCCTASRELLAMLGATDDVSFQERLSIPLVYPGGRSTLGDTPLPGPLRLAPSLLRFNALGLNDRLRVARAVRRLGACRSPAATSFGAWLRAHAQSASAVKRFWDPIVVATLNAHVDEVAVETARKILVEGFSRRGGANIGLFRVPLRSLFVAATQYITSRGGHVATAAGVRTLHIVRDRVRAVTLNDGRRLDAPSVIVAVPPSSLRRLVGDGGAPALGGADLLRWSPIVDVHMWFDRPLDCEPFVTAVGSAVQSVFDVSRIHRSPEAPRSRPTSTHVVLSQSAARRWIGMPPQRVAGELLPALRQLLPGAAGARCRRSVVIQHPRATFVPSPGSSALRPPHRSCVDGLAVAGDWTATGWPATIESAVRSGFAAADAM